MKRLLLLLSFLALALPVWASEEIGRQEDSASADGQVLMPIGCGRQDAIANSTTADGDYGLIKCNNVGRIYTSATIDAALPTGSNTIGNVGLNAGANTIGNVGINAGANAIGSVTTTSQVPGTGATNLGKAEGNAHVNADTGVAMLGVRHDVSTTGLGADGTYAAIGLSANGEVYTSANTELPTPATLADNTANPSLPAVAAYMMCFDGTNWDRCLPGLSDTDDNSVAFSQLTSLIISETHLSDGTSWVRQRVFLEDVAAAGHDGGQLLILGTVRQDVPAGSTSLDGDYANLKTDSVGRLWVNCGTGCASGATTPTDAFANPTTAALNMTFNMGWNGATWDRFQLDASKFLKVNCSAGCTTGSTTPSDAFANPTTAGLQMVFPVAWNGATWDRLQADGSKNLKVNCTTGCASGATTPTDAFANPTTAALNMTFNTGWNGATWDRLQVDASKNLKVLINGAIAAGSNTIGNVNPGTATNWGVYVEDNAETAGGNLMMIGSVRRDTANTSTNADGDNATINTDALGKVWVTGTYMEESAETASGGLMMSGGVRRDTLASSSTATGRNSTLNLTSDGAMWVANVPATNGGTTPCYLTSAATTNSTNCKASAGQLYGYDLVNTTTTIYYLRIYNLSTAPTCSSATGFVRTIPVPPASAAGGAGGVVRDLSVGEAYGTGLGFCLTGGGSSTDNTSAATGVYVTLNYR